MKRLFTLLMNIFLCSYAFVGYAQFSSGLKPASSIISNNTIGAVSWSNPSFAVVDDVNKTTSTALVIGNDTEYLFLTGFNVNVPAGMIIKGIEVVMVKSGSNGISYSVTDNEVKIVKGGAVTGNNLAVGGKWPSADQIFTYGSATEDWGTSWTLADINGSNFGVAISAHLGGLLVPTARINAVTVNVSYDVAPLPVTMLYFDAKAIHEEVHLSWATATEINNHGFTIQRSADGINWKNIMEVLSRTINSTSANSYTYTDHTPVAGKSYYRLMQTDMNNTVAYTTMVAVSNNATMDFSLYPNPANDIIRIGYSGEEKLQSITLSDLMGRSIQRYDGPEEKKEVLISAVDLLPGEYLICMASEKQVLYKKVMIRH
jgi:hypothetical protein